jgi:hypothetical protein
MSVPTTMMQSICCHFTEDLLLWIVRKDMGLYIRAVVAVSSPFRRAEMDPIMEMMMWCG